MIILHIILVITSPKEQSKAKPIKQTVMKQNKLKLLLMLVQCEDVTVHFDDGIENGNSVEGGASSVASKREAIGEGKRGGAKNGCVEASWKEEEVRVSERG